jgi:hypothetical protein
MGNNKALAVHKFRSFSFHGRFPCGKLLSGTPACGDSSTTAVSGGGGMPSPSGQGFFMVKIGWLHAAGHTAKFTWKLTTDRTKNYNLNLSKCVE